MEYEIQLPLFTDPALIPEQPKDPDVLVVWTYLDQDGHELQTQIESSFADLEAKVDEFMYWLPWEATIIDEHAMLRGVDLETEELDGSYVDVDLEDLIG